MWGCPLQRRVLLDGAGFGGAGPREVLATEITQGVGQAAMRGAGSWDVGPFGFGAVVLSAAACRGGAEAAAGGGATGAGPAEGGFECAAAGAGSGWRARGYQRWREDSFLAGAARDRGTGGPGVWGAPGRKALLPACHEGREARPGSCAAGRRDAGAGGTPAWSMRSRAVVARKRNPSGAGRSASWAWN